MPYFSIIIPTYNSAATLQKCLDSVIYQTYTDFEILIIDGVSTDNTLEITRKFNDNRIKIISEPDKGIYDAMNKGIKMAEGEWLYFLGSDDSLYDLMVLDDVFKVIRDTTVDVVYGNVMMGKINEIYDGEFTFEKLKDQNLCHQSIFFSTNIFKRLGHFEVKYKALSDYDFNLKWFTNSRYKRKYFNRIIANFSDGGYSAMYNDVIFSKSKALKVLKLGVFKLKSSELKELSREAAKIELENHKYLKYVIIRIVFYIFRLINIFDRRIRISK